MNPGEDFQYLLDKQVKEMHQKAAALTEALNQASATASSQDGSVTVTVEPNGALRELTLGHRACELGPAKLTSAIMNTVRTAQRQAANKVTDSFVAINGDDDAAGLMRSFLPAPVEPTSPEFAAPAEEAPPMRPEKEPTQTMAPGTTEPGGQVRGRRPERTEDVDDGEMRPW